MLERLCAHAQSFGAAFLEVRHENGAELVFAPINGESVRIARFDRSSGYMRDLQTDLKAAARKPIRTVIGGQVCLIKACVAGDLGRGVFEVRIEAVPKPDPSKPPPFTAKQGQYLAYIYSYTKIHGQAPSEADMERYFRVSPPSIHNMVKTLERNFLIERTPGRARSIRLLVKPEHLPRLE